MNAITQEIHLKAPGCWINDPNGFIYYQGQYHLFYQCFPYGVQWGRMHWGHAVSKDLVCWKHIGIAVFPSKYADKDGCFSGTAIELNQELYLFYTGVRYLKVNPENVNLCMDDQFVSSQMLIFSQNGCDFDNINHKREIIPSIEESSVGSPKDTRDPKVWRGVDAWYMLLGSCTKEEGGKILLFKSRDLIKWEMVHCVHKNGAWGSMWECPDYFKADNKEILSISALEILKDGKKDDAQSIFTFVRFDEKSCKMDISDDYQYFDYGFDLYAPQTTVGIKGERIVIAWARMPKPVKNSWCGMYCIPRIIEVKNNHIFFKPHPDIQKKFNRKITRISDVSEDVFRLKFDMYDGNSLSIGGYRIYRIGNTLYTDRRNVFGNIEGYREQFHTPEIVDSKVKFCIEVYVDPNLIEVYVNGGEYVITNVVYDLTDDLSMDGIKNIEIYSVTA